MEEVGREGRQPVIPGQVIVPSRTHVKTEFRVDLRVFC